MGEIYIAVTRSVWGFEKCFAIKKILPSLSRDMEFLTRFRDEARLVIPMNHRNVVQVFEVGRVDKDYFIAMELVEGVNLRQMLSKLWSCRRQWRLPVAAALFIIRELLAGLEYCHQCTDTSGLNMGVVHRDVSPANVMLSYEGSVKLADFGLALSRLKAYKTQPNQLLGHMGYMAPETLAGRAVDHRADIYGTGVLLFELLTCQRFASGDDIAVVRNLMKRRARQPPSALWNGVPPEVDALVLRAVAEDPGQRFSTAQEFHDAAQKALVQLDPLFGAHTLKNTILEPMLKPADKRRKLEALVRSIDGEEIDARRPAARTVCIGEAIVIGGEDEAMQRTSVDLSPPDGVVSTPRTFGGNLLTFIGEVFEGDTEPMQPVESALFNDDTGSWIGPSLGSRTSRRMRRASLARKVRERRSSAVETSRPTSTSRNWRDAGSS